MDDDEREQLLDLLAPRSDLSGTYVTFEVAGRMMAISVRHVRKLMDPGCFRRAPDSVGLVCGTLDYCEDVLPVLDIARSSRSAVGMLRPREALIVIACFVDGLLESAALLVPWPIGLTWLEGGANCGTWPRRERGERFLPAVGFTTVQKREVALLDVAALVKGMSQVMPGMIGDVN